MYDKVNKTQINYTYMLI